MENFADLSRRIESLIRLGTIAEVDHAARRVRVQTGALTSNWLPWAASRAGQTRDWSPPTAGEQVLLLCPSGDPAGGVALLAIYSDAFDAPSSSPDEHLTVYPDGARLLYNHATGSLSVSGVRTATVQAFGLVTVDCPETFIHGNVAITGSLTVTGATLLQAAAVVAGPFSYQSGMSGQGGASGAAAMLSGNIIHQGGALSSNGVTLHSHTHPDPHGGNTEPPR
ncbi:phage baseplate assembly protein V [Chromobacterium sp. IIBBL 290-4]|uniref:phage baseplate assembly protein V n=1 Tax=Chromobacterium sp. IIBBL 290-4 TaxID=2953890 RepID=UPI0020B8A2FE|nr:phage baseplate assembly protein V [Chromobacterium sp. IIBBL 290-4]UTH73345.1 phage baseplate assembly protein V [Chromobacterium sp. IIBBL 290-4]